MFLFDRQFSYCWSFLFMKIRNTLHFSDEIQEFCSDNYKIKKKINFTVVIYLQN